MPSNIDTNTSNARSTDAPRDGGTDSSRPPRPGVPTPATKHLPTSLAERDQWVSWRHVWRPDDGEWTKMPLDPNTGGAASSTDPETWGTIEDALAHCRDEHSGGEGVGFVLTDEDPLVGIDLDDCVNLDTGEAAPWAQEVVDDFNSYTELSPSGTGLHILVFANLPDGGNRGDVPNAPGHVEMYDSGRYLTVTGYRDGDSPAKVHERNTAVQRVHNKYISSDSESDPTSTPSDSREKTGTGSSDPHEGPGNDLTDEEVLEKAREAENGDQFSRLFDRGDLSDHGGDHSRADLALCSHLAFWTGGDREQIERIFSYSSLGGRQKWQEREDYRERTINEALSNRDEFYEPPRANGTGRSEENKPPQKQRLVSLVQNQTELFTDERNEPHAWIDVGGHRELRRVEGEAFRRWLVGTFYRRENVVPSSSTVRDAITTVAGITAATGETRKLHNRVARRGDDLWYDLADSDWRAVRISADGWSVVDNPPPMFRRYSHQKPQVDPVGGGDLRELLGPFLNVQSEADEILILTWLVVGLVPNIPRTILIPHGPQGSGKSVQSKMLRRIVDPSEVPTPQFRTQPEELAQLLDHHYGGFFDNVSGLSDRLSDALCRAVTGDGFSKRKLYTPDEDVLYSFRRLLLLNGINAPARRPDLLDRSLLVKLDRIPRDERREEHRLWTDFEERRPQIIGAVFDLLSEAMRREPDVELDRLPRMADWARWGYAVGEAAGWGGDAFLSAYREDESARNWSALESHPVGHAVVKFMDEKDREVVEEKPSALLELLRQCAERHDIDTDHKLWPGAASWLTPRLREVKPNLRDAGIEVTETGATGSPQVRIRRLGKDENASMPQSA